MRKSLTPQQTAEIASRRARKLKLQEERRVLLDALRRVNAALRDEPRDRTLALEYGVSLPTICRVNQDAAAASEAQP